MQSITFNDLNDIEKRLLDEANKVKKLSYSPYSQFSVGAALLMSENEIISGTNVENASYGLTICAERSAIVRAYAMGYRNFKLMAIIASSANNTFKDIVYPCGSCCQMIYEAAYIGSHDNDIPLLPIKNNSFEQASKRFCQMGSP